MYLVKSDDKKSYLPDIAEKTRQQEPRPLPTYHFGVQKASTVTSPFDCDSSRKHLAFPRAAPTCNNEI